MKADVVVNAENTLGEGPMWHPLHKVLYWVDIQQRVVHGFEPHTKRHRTWPVDKRVGTVVPARNGNLILGLQGEIAELNPVSGAVESLLPLESDRPENRCNDGKCDGVGRFWVGTMHLDCKPETGALYCVDSDLRSNKVLSGLTIANGMGWSPDGDYMYFIDSPEYQVWRYKFSRDKVALEEKKVAVEFDQEKGMPDGMCVDSDGNLWIGFWGGNRIGCYNPDGGNHLMDVSVPAPNVTSCCFGGPDLKTLYITTAREGLTEEQLKEFPLSGSLFSFQPNVAGLASEFFENRGRP